MIARGSQGIGIVCTRGERRKKCSTPNCSGEVTALCDYPVTRRGKVATCDAKMCNRCRVRVGPDKDYCPPHGKRAASDPPAGPQRGDRRVHVATGINLWVFSVDDHEGNKLVTFGRNPPDARGRCAGPMQTVTLAQWNEKTRAP